MTDPLKQAAERYPDKIALIDDDQHWTFADLNQEVGAFCAVLVEVGVQPGERVGALLANTPQYIFLIHALRRLGMVLVPLNLRLTAEELRYQVEAAGCRLVVHDRAETELPPLPVDTIHIDELRSSTQPPKLSFEAAPDTPQAIVFTSGTTGKPKGAVLTIDNFNQAAAMSAARLGVQLDDRWLLCLPLYHVGGLSVVIRSAIYGTAVVLQNGFDVSMVCDALEHQAVTLVSLVPTQLYRLLDTLPSSLPHLRLILLGGAAATPDLLTRAAHLPVATTYGLTEACSQVATALPDAATVKPGTVGKPLPGISIQVVDDQGKPLPSGEIGEIIVSGANVMRGYYRNREATTNVLHDGKLYTGDLGYLDADGDLWIVQRRSDLIVTGGENVYPAEVEAVLKSHPAVADAAVIGLPDAEWGQRVAAVVVLRIDMPTSTTEELVTFCRQHLAGYKVPRVIQIVETLPLTASGKVERRNLREVF